MMKSLSYKIGLGFFMMICINVGIAVFAIYHIDQLSKPIDQILKEKYQNVSAAEAMIQALKQQELVQIEMMEVAYDSVLAKEFLTYRNAFYNAHQKAIEGIALPKEPIYLDSIKQAYEGYLSRSLGFQRMLGSELPPQFIQSFQMREIFPLVTEVERLCNRIDLLNQRAIADADAKTKRFSSQGKVFITIIAVAAIFLSLLISFRFTANILKPVRETTETVRKIGQGHLNQKIAITTNDEIAELGREFNKMTERLHEYEKMNIQQILLEKRKSEAIVSGMPASVIVTDKDNRLSLMNERAVEVLDIDDPTWQGKSVRNVVKNERLASLLCRENGHHREEHDVQKALIPLEMNGENRYFFSRQLEITDDSEKGLGFVTLLQDVTSFKNLDRLKSEFMATISHEFRTPLTSINMAVDILLREVCGDLNEKQRDLLNDAKDDCLRLRNLVKDLLDLSKLESGNYQLNMEQIDAGVLVETSIKPLRFSLDEKEIQCSTEVAGNLPPFQGDFNRLSRLLTNLIDNALQYSSQGSKIDIGVSEDEGDVQFCVADYGEGIPAEAIDLIFDKFVQVKHFKDAAKGNIGLGLAISREIVHAHGGEIWVESTLGEGSRFYFSIPMVKGEA